MFAKYSHKLAKTEEHLTSLRLRLLQAGETEELAALEEPEAMYVERLQGGLFGMQQMALVLGFACARAESQSLLRMSVMRRLRSERAVLRGCQGDEDIVLAVQREYVSRLDAESSASERAAVLSWTAALSSTRDA